MQPHDHTMRHSNQLREISIKVPAPFAGISDLGFTAQYRAQDFQQPMRDVPLVIEGPRGVRTLEGTGRAEGQVRP